MVVSIIEFPYEISPGWQKNYEMPVLAKTNPANDYGSFYGSAANHQYVLANVVDVLKGRSALHIEPSQAMKVVEIIERIYALR